MSKKQKIQNKKLREVKKVLDHIRKTTPKAFTQMSVLDGLFDDTLAMIYLSNRSDGKTTFLYRFLTTAAIEAGFKTLIITASDYVQRTLFDEIYEVVNKYTDYDAEMIFYQNKKFMNRLQYNKKTIMGIANLDDASQLKNNPQLLSEYDLIIFDEFIRLPEEYTLTEIERYNMIRETVDKDFTRGFEVKSLLTGNPINFESPFFEEWDLFETLATFPLNTSAKIEQEIQDFNNSTFVVPITLEMRRNENVNKMKSRQMFRDRQGSLSGEFAFNRYGLQPIDKFAPHSVVTIRISRDMYYRIYRQNKEIIVDLSSRMGKEDYVTDITFLSDKNTFLDDSYYSDYGRKAHEQKEIKYTNAYTRSMIQQDSTLIQIDVQRLAKYEEDIVPTENQYITDLIRREQVKKQLRNIYENY